MATTFNNKAITYSSDEENDVFYEDQYAEQIGKSVKCKQFINNVVATRGQGQAPVKQTQVQVKQAQTQVKQAQTQVKQAQTQVKQAQTQVKQVQVKQVQVKQVQVKQVHVKQVHVKQEQALVITEREVVDDWEDLM